MTGRDEFVRQHPQLALQLDRIGQRAMLAAALRDVRASGQVDTDLIFGGLPVTAGFGVLVTGMTAWSWSLWLLLPAILLGTGVLASAGEALKWLGLFSRVLAVRWAWLRGGRPNSRGGGRR